MTDTSQPAEAEAPQKYRKKDAAEIFAVDRRVWAYVCSLGFDAATAYIIMASGTGHDQRTTWWSASAIEKWAGMRWYPANEAITLLKSKGVVHEVARKGSRPGYKLSAAHEIRGCEGALPDLNDDEFEVYWTIALKGSMWVPQTNNKHREDWGDVGRPYDVALRLTQRGWLKALGNQWFEAVVYDEEAASRPDWIWLPNAIVVGAGDETPPIKRLRRAQNPLALRLFVDLYHGHALTRHGGIEWRYPHGIHSRFKRFELGQRGLFKVWGFTPDNPSLSWKGSKLLTPYGGGDDDNNPEGSKAFWEAFSTLRRLGIVEMVPHLVANEVCHATPEPDLIHPVPMDNGTEEERAITAAAARAAEALVHPERWKFAIERKNAPIVPVPAEYEQVQLIGIPRMTYRPQTEVTKRWFAEGSEAWAQKVADFMKLEAAATDPAVGQALRNRSRDNQG